MKNTLNKIKYITQITTFICSSLIFSQAKAQDLRGYIQNLDKISPDYNFKVLRLNEAIEQGIRKNHNQHLREYEGTLLDLNWKDSYASFWFPQVKLVLQTEKLLSTFGEQDQKNSYWPLKSASGTAGIEVEDYTLFNWGKDYLSYNNSRTSYFRNRTILDEKKRELKQNICIAFFKLLSKKQIENVMKEQVRHTSFIYRLNREKLTLKKIRKQEFLQSRDEYLRAQTEYNDARIDSRNEDENLSYMIGDPDSTRYVIKQKLIYKKIFMTVDEAIRMALQNAPTILNSVTNLENANRDYELSIKETLPLPKLTIRLGAYKHTFGQNTNQTKYHRTELNTDTEIVASINASWTLLGKSGLFNARKRTKALVSKNMAIKNYVKNKGNTRTTIRRFFQTILYLQNQLDLLEARVTSLEKGFDTTLDNYVNNRTSFINLKDTLSTLTASRAKFEKTRFEHIELKINLSQIIGIENLPNEIVEKLITDG